MKRSLVFVAALMAVSQVAGGSVTLVSRGTAHYHLVLPEDVHEMELSAAEEFETYMARLAGVADLRRADIPDVRVEIGRAAEKPALQEQIAVDDSAFFIEVSDGIVRLRGTTPTATLYAVYDLLERLGCRWFMPGEIGEVVPTRPHIEVANFSVVEIPAFTGRILEGLPDGPESELWALRNKLGGVRFPSAHAWERLVPPQQYFETHPEYFALVDGRRTPKQLCTSNPAVALILAQRIVEKHEADPDRTWFGIGPNDDGGFCECDDCTALDTGDIDPFSGNVSLTDRLITFFNAVAAQVHQVYPDLRFGFYAYDDYTRPPTDVMPDASIIPALAPVNLCRLHGMGDALCPERTYHQSLIRGWTRICSEVYHRGYSYNVGGPNLPLNYASRWAFEIPYCGRNGVTGFRVETQMSWANYGPLGYLMAKFMWDTHEDMHELLDDYHTRFYGPAARPMGQYWTLMDRARRDTARHTGNAVNIPDIYDARVMMQMEQHLKEAERVARNEPTYRERVHITRRSFDYLNAFLRMRDAAGSQRWRRAGDALERMREIGTWFVQYDPPLMHPGGGLVNLERYWAPIIEKAVERTQHGNSHVASLRDTWRVFIDPSEAGEDLSYHSPRLDDNAWQTMRTYSKSWSDQGLRYYKGILWYRQRIDVSGRWGGRRLILWFGGIDEDARVWVNGTYVGAIETNGWQPAELDITHAVRVGQENLIAVRVVNRRLNELGTGGITQPVMIWSPTVDD